MFSLLLLFSHLLLNPRVCGHTNKGALGKPWKSKFGWESPRCFPPKKYAKGIRGAHMKWTDEFLVRWYWKVCACIISRLARWLGRWCACPQRVNSWVRVLSSAHSKGLYLYNWVERKAREHEITAINSMRINEQCRCWMNHMRNINDDTYRGGDKGQYLWPSRLAQKIADGKSSGASWGDAAAPSGTSRQAPTSNK